MTLLAPVFIWAAAAVAGGIVALHFIVTRQPRSSILPTARFVPDSPATAIVRDSRPADPWLLLIRVLIILAAGAALAKPVITPSRRPVGRVFLMDVSRATADIGEAADSVRTLFRDGDGIVVFDSIARPVEPPMPDSLSTVRPADVPGNISAALIAGLRMGSALRDRVDSIELIVVSPLLAEELDAATDSIRSLWPGRARLIRIAAARGDSTQAVGRNAISLKADSEDPLAVTVSIVAKRGAGTNVRISRGAILTAEDSAWLNGANNVVVLWPALDRPPLSVARSPVSQSGGLVGRDFRLVANFGRRWEFPADSLRGTRTIVRWADGEPAAVEKSVGRGCLKSVAIPVATIGDMVIRADFVRLAELIAAPCDERFAATPIASTDIASFAGSGALAPRDGFEPRDNVPSPLAPYLLGLALAAALGELLVRGRERDGKLS